MKQTYGVLNHRILWFCAERNLSLGQQRHKDAFLFNLTSMVMAYFSFEGYLNYLGELIAPEVWKDELHFFTRKPYDGTLGKYHFLMKITIQDPPPKTRRPHLTIIRLAELRNFVAHSRPEFGQRTARFSKKTGFPTEYRHELSKRVSKTKAKHALEDVKKLLGELHDGAKQYYGVPMGEPFGTTWSWAVAGL